MWLSVWTVDPSPQSQYGELVKFHLNLWFAEQPCPERKRFSIFHSFRSKVKPFNLIFGSFMRFLCSSWCHRSSSSTFCEQHSSVVILAARYWTAHVTMESESNSRHQLSISLRNSALRQFSERVHYYIKLVHSNHPQSRPVK